MNLETKQQILKLLTEHGPIGPSAIASALQISPQMIHRHLKSLLISGKIRKQGTPPKVLYFAITEKETPHHFPTLPDSDSDYIENNYMIVKPDGAILMGLQGFQWWAAKTNQHKHFKALAHEYVINHTTINSRYRNKLDIIDATFKIKDTFEKCYLDHLFYQEFYSTPKFGKTKTGHMIFLGKSGQNIRYIQMLAQESKNTILKIIKHYHIDCVIFTPHSVPRKISFLKVFEQYLNLNIPHSSLNKVFVNDTPIPQKSLSKLSDRIENASNTIFIRQENKTFKRILVIDDAVGSGATLNIIAKKLKNEAGVEFVCGFAVTGSLKGFEVVKEI